jgi:C-terminal processing protease CtpA/Prc
MECPICYEIIKNSCIGSCTHHFCYKCLLKWCYNGGSICPVCREQIYEIRLDKEFDKLNNQTNDTRIMNEYKIIKINFEDNINPGITLCNTKNIGVKVKCVNPGKIMYKAGIRNNDIILFLNEIPCIDHAKSIKIIDHCYRTKRELKVEILENKDKNKIN